MRGRGTSLFRRFHGRGDSRGARRIANHRETGLGLRQGMAAPADEGQRANGRERTRRHQPASEQRDMNDASSGSERRWSKMSRIYHAALAQPREQRDAFVAAACAGDEELFRELQSMLMDEAAMEGFL